MKHTAPPWLMSDHKTGFPILCTGPEGDLVTLEGNREDDADAKLCAAAPDLLAALKDLWGYVEDLQKSNPGYLGKLCLQDYARMNSALRSAPAAIAKAEGTA